MRVAMDFGENSVSVDNDNLRNWAVIWKTVTVPFYVKLLVVITFSS
jgi:hypothetical protein